MRSAWTTRLQVKRSPTWAPWQADRAILFGRILTRWWPRATSSARLPVKAAPCKVKIRHQQMQKSSAKMEDSRVAGPMRSTVSSSKEWSSSKRTGDPSRDTLVRVPAPRSEAMPKSTSCGSRNSSRAIAPTGNQGRHRVLRVSLTRQTTPAKTNK